MHRFKPLLVFNYRALQFIVVLENDAFSCHWHVKINIPFNKDQILTKKFGSAERIQCIKVVKRIST